VVVHLPGEDDVRVLLLDGKDRSIRCRDPESAEAVIFIRVLSLSSAVVTSSEARLAILGELAQSEDSTLVVDLIEKAHWTMDI
jgi:hypothetical protein